MSADGSLATAAWIEELTPISVLQSTSATISGLTTVGIRTEILQMHIPCQMEMKTQLRLI